MTARTVAPGVTVNPEVCFGDPTVAGTGIRTWAIADRFRGGDGLLDLGIDYRLTLGQLQAALRWEMLSPGQKKRRIAKAGK